MIGFNFVGGLEFVVVELWILLLYIVLIVVIIVLVNSCYLLMGVSLVLLL